MLHIILIIIIFHLLLTYQLFRLSHVSNSPAVACEKCFTNNIVFEESNSRSRIHLDTVQAHTPDLKKAFSPQIYSKDRAPRNVPHFSTPPTSTTLNLSLPLHPSFQAPLFKPPSKSLPHITLQKSPPSFIDHQTPIFKGSAHSDPFSSPHTLYPTLEIVHS